MNSSGPSYGYFANDKKTWLVVKEFYEAVARDLFSATNVQITTAGRPYLGAPLGSDQYIIEFIQSKADLWKSIVLSLSEIASSQPHAAYSAFTRGVSHLWEFLCRTTPNIAHLLEPLEQIICAKFIPALTGRDSPSPIERRLLSLPARLGGLNIVSPASLSREYDASMSITAPLTSLIIDQSLQFPAEVLHHQRVAKSDVQHDRRSFSNSEAKSILGELTGDLQLAVLLAQEKGASSWLTSLPILEHGHALHKGAFQDALALRYGWTPLQCPLNVFAVKAFGGTCSLLSSRRLSYPAP